MRNVDDKDLENVAGGSPQASVPSDGSGPGGTIRDQVPVETPGLPEPPGEGGGGSVNDVDAVGRGGTGGLSTPFPD